VVSAGWVDVPHLDPETRDQMLAATPPHMRKAESTGEASMGAGTIYPVDPDVLKIDPFPIPPHCACVRAGRGLDLYRCGLGRHR
jgi:hypothetical protein